MNEELTRHVGVSRRNACSRVQSFLMSYEFSETWAVELYVVACDALNIAQLGVYPTHPFVNQLLQEANLKTALQLQ
jgi:hypothetical protein